MKRRLRVKRMDVGASSLVRQGAEPNSQWLVIQDAAEEEEDDGLTQVFQEGLEAIDATEDVGEKLDVIDRIANTAKELIDPSVTQSEDLTERLGGWTTWVGFRSYVAQSEDDEELAAKCVEFAEYLGEELGVEQAVAKLVSRKATPLHESETPSNVDLPEAEEGDQRLGPDDDGDDAALKVRNKLKSRHENVKGATVKPMAAGEGSHPASCPKCGMDMSGVRQEESCTCEVEQSEEPTEEPTVEQAEVLPANKGRIEDLDGPVAQAPGSKWGTLFGEVFTPVEQEAPSTDSSDLREMVQQAVAAAIAPLVQENAALREQVAAKPTIRSRQPDADPGPVRQDAPRSIWQGSPLDRLFG